MTRQFSAQAMIMAFFLVFSAFLTGCGMFDAATGSQPAAATSELAGDASLAIRLALPPQAEGIEPSSTIRAVTTGARVKVVLQVRQPGSAANKPFSIVKLVDVVGDKAETTISALPAGVVVVRLLLENASVEGWKDFHGAGDLVANTTKTVDVSPPGSKLPADVLATTLQEAIKNDTLMAAAGSSLATNLLNAIKLIDVNSGNPYAAAADTLIEQVKPTGMIKLVFDNSARTLTGFNGTTQAWQKSYGEILGTNPIAGIAPTAFNVVRVIRQGFDSYSLVEWRDNTSLMSLVTCHSNQTGVKQAMFVNQGILDGSLQLSSTDYLLSGYNVSQKAPAVWRWNTTKNSFAEGLSAAQKNLEWEKFFTTEVYTVNPTTGLIVQNLVIDGAGTVSALVKMQSGITHSYLVDPVTGALTANYPTDVVPNQPPTVSLTAPAAGASIANTQTVTITANPIDNDTVTTSDSDGSVVEVEFLANGTVLGKATAAPWSYSWSGMNAGTYKLVARAFDNKGFSGLSSPVEITITGTGPVNQAPTVSLTAPADNSTYTFGSSASLKAEANDTDGTISKVEFYAGTTLIGTDNVSPYEITWAQPAAGTYSLKAKAYDNSNASTESTAVTIIVNKVIGPDLMITEIGTRDATYSHPFWVEFTNKSNSSIQLSEYTILCPSLPPGGGTITKAESFPLPSYSLPAGAFVIVRFNNSIDEVAGPQVVHATVPATNLPFWRDWGYLDLRKSNVTVDYVKFGEGVIPTGYDPAPEPATEWSGSAVQALPRKYGYSLARNLTANDNNTASNWSVKAFHTPAAYNDVISDLDEDGDGIPDSNEEYGTTFCGLPYYDWGARAGTKDIFVHIDYMNPANCPDPLAVTPRIEALQKIQAAFNRKAIKIHFDVGTLFGSTVDNFCMDGRSHQVTYAPNLHLRPSYYSVNAFTYKAQSMPISKVPVFHYCLFGFLSQPEGAFGGIGETPGNDFVVTIGFSKESQYYSTSSADNLNYLVNSQASTLMHELGHNLGLQHGGDVDVNYKPNYFSIMNYMYSNNGLPTIGDAKEGDRYYYYRYNKAKEQIFADRYLPNGGWIDLHKNAYAADMLIDYSDGSGKDISETAISESVGIGRTGSKPVDFNGDGDTLDENLAMDLNPAYPGDESQTPLKDHNDWGVINLRFSNTDQGLFSIRASNLQSLPEKADYISNDRQEFIVCDPMCRHGKK